MARVLLTALISIRTREKPSGGMYANHKKVISPIPPVVTNKANEYLHGRINIICKISSKNILFDRLPGGAGGACVEEDELSARPFCLGFGRRVSFFLAEVIGDNGFCCSSCMHGGRKSVIKDSSFL